jgi:hypothetical protein
LADYPFTPRIPADGALQIGLISEIVPFVTGARRVVIYSDVTRSEITSKNISANAPTVNFTSRMGPPGLPISAPLVLNWRGSDPDGDALSYTLLYSPDDRVTWRALVTGIRDTRATVDPSQLEGTHSTGVGYFRVIANDGILTGFGDTSPFTIGDKPPIARIISPAGGSAFEPGQTVTLEGMGQDTEDGTLDDERFVWQSSRDGFLGGGHLAHTRHLSEGIHEISLTVNDSTGQAATATTNIAVGSPVLQISCANTADSNTVQAVGGADAAGVRWRLRSNEAVALVEHGKNLFVNNPITGTTRVVLAERADGTKYLKTVNDTEGSSTLVHLPMCS